VKRISQFVRALRDVREKRDGSEVLSSLVAPVMHLPLVSLTRHERRTPRLRCEHPPIRRGTWEAREDSADWTSREVYFVGRANRRGRMGNGGASTSRPSPVWTKASMRRWPSTVKQKIGTAVPSLWITVHKNLLFPFATLSAIVVVHRTLSPTATRFPPVWNYQLRSGTNLGH